MATFHRFSDLPRELRDEIWTFVIRAAGPGVHVFRLYNREMDNATGAQDVAFPDYYPMHRLAAPTWNRYFDNVDARCGDKNVSTYLIDGGLWTACKESRTIMEKHFKNLKWNSRRKRDKKGRTENNTSQVLDMPATGYFSDEVPHYFTVFPHRDLFVFQSENLKSILWEDIDIDIPIGSSIKGFQGLNHVALEYDSEWGIQMYEAGYNQGPLPIVRILINLACGLSHVFKIWLIDHNLKRKEDAPAFKENTMWHDTNAYYASDRRFLEVKCDGRSMGLNQEQWQYLQQVADGDYYKSSMWFISRLQGEINLAIDPDDTEAEYACDIGLLGWDRLS
ncbi:hypothetical protein FSARC_3668 [Fusarium sarcochroum]|uniref:2EXR domain-containing protein n=1 Tax=Fusarium sarcochroum TaxID=1208366 RepID=A0A8H4U3L1_9HYPO|nr:hypothetical protein FSARC_3668 [Fusarium sarcochroum]